LIWPLASHARFRQTDTKSSGSKTTVGSKGSATKMPTVSAICVANHWDQRVFSTFTLPICTPHYVACKESDNGLTRKFASSKKISLSSHHLYGELLFFIFSLLILSTAQRRRSCSGGIDRVCKTGVISKIFYLAPLYTEPVKPSRASIHVAGEKKRPYSVGSIYPNCRFVYYLSSRTGYRSLSFLSPGPAFSFLGVK